MQHWDSQPDSGYSVDNLGLPVPAPFSGNYASGSAYLSWGASPASDLSNYRLYRGVILSFVPAIGNRIASPTQASFTDPAGAPYWYKLSAVDAHGNESGFATLLPTGTTDVAGAPRELRIDPPSPNPSRGAIAFRVALPAAARVGVEMFDQLGRRVGAIAERAMEAGQRELTWNGLGEDGRPIASGLYFYQVRIGDRTMRGRIAIVR